jgi:flagellar basal-body rod protein FlgB
MEQVVLHDGSDVSVEHQVSELAKNQHLHSLAVSTMRSQFALLRAAITERA